MGTQNKPFSSHILYVDDMFIFYDGTKSNIRAPSSFFDQYAWAFGQMFSTVKSSLYVGSMICSRLIVCWISLVLVKDISDSNTLGF